VKLVSFENRPAWAKSWEMRLVGLSPVHPALSGLVFAMALVAIYLLIESLAGGRVIDTGGEALAVFPEPTLGFAIAAAAAGYALGAGYVINAGNEATLQELRPLLAEPAAELARRSDVTLRASRVYGCIGLVCGVLFTYAADEPASRMLRLEVFSSDALLSLMVLPLAFWLFMRAAYFTISGIQSVASVVERDLSVDLLDLTWLSSLGQMALRAALLWIGAAVVASLSVLLTQRTIAEFLAIMFLLSVATVTFVIPVRGVHRKMGDAKREELLRLSREIRRDREEIRVLAPGARDAAARLPALLAYESRIRSVQEWPFDTPTLLRFAFYLTIPVVSWLGGAFVERLIESWLG
jgi:hypothetical protein